ncbi:hypothetical protein JCM31598_26020 [Desulfonatronum parangueonense]
MGIADDDDLRFALSINKQTDLPSHVDAEHAQFPSLLRGVSLSGRITPLVQTIQRFELAGLQACCVALDLAGYVGTSVG